jgi:hypothetical protein
MTYRVVILNQTARSGKDVSAQHLLDKYGSEHVNVVSFKQKLIDATAKVLGISVEEFLQNYDSKAFDVLGFYQSIEWYKDYPIYTIGDKKYSKRTALIHVSENVLKPLFGKGVFGEALKQDLQYGKVNIVSDGGFAEELEPLNDCELLVLQRDRLETNWKGDSRGWVSGEKYGGSTCFYYETGRTGDEELEHYFDWTETMIRETFDWTINKKE